jgi:hypothetical protein
MELNGRVAQRGGEPVLIVMIDDEEETFALMKVREGVYELVDERELTLNGLSVELVITEKNVVTHYCEFEDPEQIEEAEVE